MPLLLTEFHLYWRNHVLQDSYSNTSGKQDKRCKAESVKKKCTKGIKAKAYLHAKPGPSTDVEVTQAQPETHQSKVVVSGVAQGAPTPDPAPLGPSLLWQLHGGM